jgi:hypothetical protein
MAACRGITRLEAGESELKKDVGFSHREVKRDETCGAPDVSVGKKRWE